MFPTHDQLLLADYVEQTWKRQTRLELPLREFLPQPTNKGLLHIWRYGTADIAVLKTGKVVAIIEPGGSHHWDEKQQKNDARKAMLCKVNGVKCIHIMNGVFEKLTNRQKRRIIGALIFSGKVG